MSCALCDTSDGRCRFVVSGSGRKWCRTCRRAVFCFMYGKRKSERLLKKLG